VPIATTNLTVFGIDVALGVDTLKSIKSAIVGLLGLAAVIGWYGSVARRERAIRWDPALWLVSGVLGLAAISTLASLDPWYALFGSYQYRQGLFMLLFFGVVLLLIVQAVRGARGMRWLALAVVIGSVPVAFYALVQVVGLDPARWGAPAWALARGFSTLGNPDNLGGYLIFPTTLALGLALGEKRLASRYALWSAFGLGAVALLMTQVRGAWLGMSISALVLLVFAVRSRLRLQKHDWIALAVVAALLLGAGVSAGDSIARRVGDMFSGDRDAGSGRIALWETGLRAAAAHPLLGVGPDSFRLGHYETRSSAHEELGGYATVADDAHSLPIMIAATLGIPALLLSAFFLFLVVRRSSARAFRRQAEQGGGRPRRR
jgi:putative inorganic carbon (HCO3(-)) transporter